MGIGTQILTILKLNFKLKYKTFLGLGVFIYLGVALFAILNPTIFGLIGSAYSDPKFSNTEMILMVGFVLAFITNIFLLIHPITDGFTGKKRDFFLLPYDYYAKISALAIYLVSWIAINLFSGAICLLLGMFRHIRWDMLTIPNMLEFISVLIKNNGFHLIEAMFWIVCMLAFYVLFIIVYSLIKFEKGSFKNSILITLMIIIYSFFGNLVESAFQTIGYFGKIDEIVIFLLIIINTLIIVQIGKKMNIEV